MYTLTLLLWQYRAYVMDSVSSDQAIITSHRHSSMHTYTHTLCTTPSQSCLLPFYTIPILPLFNSKDFSFTCLFSFFYSVMTGHVYIHACSWPSHAKNRHIARTCGKMWLLTSWRVVSSVASVSYSTPSCTIE